MAFSFFSRRSWSGHAAILIGVALAAAAITGWVSSSLSNAAQERLEQRFRQAAATRADLVRQRIVDQLDNLTTLQRLFSSVEAVDWRAFEAFAGPMVGDRGIRGFGWLPVVEAADRDNFERRARRIWGNSFAISERNAEGATQPVGDRPRYFPVLYAVPYEPNHLAIGVNLHAASNRGPLIEQAIDTGLQVSSDLGPLLIDNRQTDTVVICAPVYRGGKVPPTRDQRRAAIRGIVLGVLSMNQMFDAANAGDTETGLNVFLVDQTRPEEQQLIRAWTPAGQPPTQRAKAAAINGYRAEVEIGRRLWSVEIEATPGWLERNYSPMVPYVPLLGALFTLLLLIYLHNVLNRRAMAEELVRERTADLLERQNSYRTLVENLPVIISRYDAQYRHLFTNASFERSLGLQPGSVLGRTVREVFADFPDLDAALIERWERALAAVYETNCAQQIEFGFPTLQGPRFFDGVLVPEHTKPTGETSILGIFHEITERHVAEAWARKLSLVVEQNPATIIITDTQGRIEYVNDKFVETTGYAKDEVIGQTPAILKSGRTPAATYADLWAKLKAGDTWHGEFENRRRDGSLYHERAMVAPVEDSQGRTTSFVAIKEDVSELRQMIDRLHESESRFRGVVSAMAEGLMLWSHAGKLIFANPAAEEIFADSQETFSGGVSLAAGTTRLREDGTPFASEDWPWVIAIREACEVRETVMGLRAADGSVRWILINASPLCTGTATQANAAVATFTDITERKAAQQRAEFLAHHDPLTGLPNRLLLRDRLEQALALARRSHGRVALMFLDLDRFKTINDSLGHPVGDKLLQAVVARLGTCVRESDTISRQGGDEFLIVLRDAGDSESVSRLADKIQQRMGEPFLIDQHALSTSFSIGISLFPDDGDDFDSLTQKADTAMYHAKHSGRNAHRFFTEQMNVQAVEHMHLETRLRRALERSEFVLHYQPQIDLASGAIVGVEALVRWQSPDHGLVAPAKFIPIAEETGLIVPLGKWVLGEACRQASAWQAAGLPPFSVAVNLSGVQFRRSDLLETVINSLVLADLDSQWLELELTESILIHDAEATLDTARRLKAIGVKLSVDDFGTGYSSLAYLKRFAVDKLKIARPFVRDLVSNADDAAIVRAIVQMAHALKLRAIAEGVEDAEVAAQLRLCQCDEIQGYWIARPMPADALAAFVLGRQPA
ncbi:MAG: EAL domain-containing protein [Candidatus Accumulibacter sp.]|uniref:EAL domain-containing protein n=1 Tax=Accumulibacter sp. TaxID=2053492 RepID=UPI001A497C68|nr:EAL domain-containing protein [Accumulibacter sp.]MBL8369442.1 EAL domain-containing protein [Accumulibacter sp.]